MIDHNLPKDWKDLQDKVAEILEEIGYKTETEKKIETARGIVEVDVFSKDESQTPNIVYLCQCKHWERRVPKEVVHAFRTVVRDYGANFGIIISKKGFQRGAYEAAKNTNIILVDWFDFQHMFEDKWLPAICKKLCDECETFIDYTEPIVTSFIARKYDQLGEDKDKVDKFRKLREKYMNIGVLIVHLRYGPLYFKVKPKFPLLLEVPSEEEKKVKISSLREYVNFLRFWCQKGLKEFNEFFDTGK